MFKLFKTMRKSKKGFTLTELIVVVAILGVLAVVATPIIGGQLTKAKANTDTANATTILNVLKRADAAGASANGTVANFSLLSSSTANVISAITDELGTAPVVNSVSTDKWIITRTYTYASTVLKLSSITVTHGAAVTASEPPTAAAGTSVCSLP